MNLQEAVNELNKLPKLVRVVGVDKHAEQRGRLGAIIDSIVQDQDYIKERNKHIPESAAHADKIYDIKTDPSAWARCFLSKMDSIMCSGTRA